MKRQRGEEAWDYFNPYSIHSIWHWLNQDEQNFRFEMSIFQFQTLNNDVGARVIVYSDNVSNRLAIHQIYRIWILNTTEPSINHFEEWAAAHGQMKWNKFIWIYFDGFWLWFFSEGECKTVQEIFIAEAVSTLYRNVWRNWIVRKWDYE